MNRANYKIRSPKKQKAQYISIRSPAFRKKYDDGMPRINGKYVQFHNLYQIDVPDKTIPVQRELKFWGCVMTEKKKYRSREKTISHDRRFSQTRGETIFKKYMKRRPSLTLTPRSFEFDEEKNDKKHETITDFRSQKIKQYKPNPQFFKAKQNQQNLDGLLLTSQDLSKINKKKLYQMSPQQLEISIQWKKKFLEIFQKKMKQAQNFQYNFKPYKI